ncbi:hypothetical protein [Bacillus toyonensis]|uniref:hypothetical protein n=1 Tax=Bacillus toyonensis TaxID=155322 RepID=UPI0036AC4A72
MEELTKDLVERSYRDKLRILLILYFFSDEIDEKEDMNPTYVRVFKSEVRIQKIDFLIRYPDYLSFELLNLLENDKVSYSKNDIKNHVKNIFNSNEPDFRRDEMHRYFFGAYEEIDHIILFLEAYGFIKYKSRKNVSGKIFDKIYYLTEFGVDKIEHGILKNSNKVNWYRDRCVLIKTYFGDLSGSELKVRQYEHKEYRTTPINEYIKGIQEGVKSKYFEIFKEEL